MTIGICLPNNASIIFLMTLCMYTYFVVPHLSYFAILSYLEEENGHIHTYSMFWHAAHITDSIKIFESLKEKTSSVKYKDVMLSILCTNITFSTKLQNNKILCIFYAYRSLNTKIVCMYYNLLIELSSNTTLNITR